MSLWILMAIVIIFKIISLSIVRHSVGDKNWGLLVVWVVVALMISVGWLLPTVVNSILLHLNIDMQYTWQQLLAPNLLLYFYFADTNSTKKD